MKRILKAGIGLSIVSMLFTGCGSGSVVSALGIGYQEIEWQTEAYNPGDMPDYERKNNDEKFKNLQGQQAFVISEKHSQFVEDIEDFEIGTLLEDGTFIYKYTSRENYAGWGSSEDSGIAYVHCVAAYNYRTETFKVIHENFFYRYDVNEDEESFYLLNMLVKSP